MGLKEYEVDGPAGKQTIQLDDEDAERRGLSGGKAIDTPAQEFDSATSLPKTTEPEAAPDTPDVTAQLEGSEEPRKASSKREQAASKAYGAKNKSGE